VPLITELVRFTQVGAEAAGGAAAGAAGLGLEPYPMEIGAKSKMTTKQSTNSWTEIPMTRIESASVMPDNASQDEVLTSIVWA
jgi:hypothetical protein